MRLLARPAYYAAALGLSTFMFVAFSWIPIIGTIVSYATDPALGLSDVSALVLTLLGSTVIDTLSTNPFLLVLSIVMGTNLVLLVYFFRTYRPGVAIRGLPVSVLGVIASIIGIGCAACGAVFLTAFSASAAGLLLALPFGGKELGCIGIALLLFSTWHLTKTISRLSS